jgi:hypothetical protein
MPATKDDVETAKVKRQPLADLLGVTPSCISQAAHGKYFVRNFPVWEWAVWHPRGNTIRFYRVPKPLLRDLVPPEEHILYGL